MLASSDESSFKQALLHIPCVFDGIEFHRRARVKGRIKRERVPLGIRAHVNCSWSLDFVQQALYCGKRFRTLNVIDERVRECLAGEAYAFLWLRVVQDRREVKLLDQFIGGIEKHVLPENVLD